MPTWSFNPVLSKSQTARGGVEGPGRRIIVRRTGRYVTWRAHCSTGRPLCRVTGSLGALCHVAGSLLDGQNVLLLLLLWCGAEHCLYRVWCGARRCFT